MTKCLRRTLIAALVVGLTLTTLYEAATRVGRGWLRGEAFYEGRPTSYWRSKIDDLMERFDDAEKAEHSIDLVSIGSNSKDGASWHTRRSIYRCGWDRQTFPPRPKAMPQTWATRLLNTVRSHDEPLDSLPPKVLWGWHDAEAVLSELAADAKYRLLTDRAFKNVELVRTIMAEGAEPTLSLDEPTLTIL